MGIYSRDYIRESPREGGGFGGPAGLWAIKYIVIANCAVFAAQFFTRDAVTLWLDLTLEEFLYSAQVWRVLTYGFCHSLATLSHILFNMYALWMFGRLIEPILGSREFLAFYLLGIVISGLCFLGVDAIPGGNYRLVGASGGVMAVVFLAAMFYPREKVLLFFVIPIEFRWLAVLYAVFDLSGYLQGDSNVAHSAHLGGAAFGVAYKYFGWRLTGSWSRMRRRVKKPAVISNPNVRIYQPSTEEPKENYKERVDAILEKIHAQGESSLTDQEREFLKDASRRYKDR